VDLYKTISKKGVITMALTAKQQRFVDEYMIDLNATQAAIRAGYSERTASETGYENLRKPQIAEEIAKRQQKHAEKSEMTVEWVLQQYRDIILGTKETEPNTARGALDSVAKHLGMFKEKVEHSGEINIKVGLPKGFGDNDED